MKSEPLAADPGLTGTSPDALAVTPANADLAEPARGFMFSADGDIRVTTFRGETRNFPSGTFPVKTQINLGVRRIHATGTTATGFVVFL